MRFEIVRDTGSLRVDDSIIGIARPRAQVERQLALAGFTLDKGNETRSRRLWRRAGGVEYALHFDGDGNSPVARLTILAYP